MTQQQLPIVEGVASRIERILARCDKVKRGSSLFDEVGQREANRIAAADANPPRESQSG